VAPVSASGERAGGPLTRLRGAGSQRSGVGSTDLLIQTEFQRGCPYLYVSTDLDISFVVIGDVFRPSWL